MDHTIKELVEKIRYVFKLKTEIKGLDSKKKELNEEYLSKSKEIISILESNEMDKLETDVGTFSYQYRSTFKVPKEEGKRKEFFDHLKKRGIFDQIITVNSRTLNAWAKEEEQASGSIDFQIPGLEKAEEMAIPYLKTK